MKIIALNRVCPICGALQGKFLEHISMTVPQYFTVAGSYDVVACCECGFVYADVVGKQENYNSYYANYNNYSALSDLKENIYDKICDERVKFLEKYLKKEYKILDIGCGAGDLLKKLKKRGYCNLFGIDPSDNSIRVLNDSGIAGCVGNIFDEVPLGLENSFDVVLCTAVMEHIYDLRQAILQLKKYINKQSGKIYIDVPAVEGFDKYITPIPNYFNHEHINYFSLNSLDNLLNENGLSRVNSETESYYLYETKTKIKEMVLQGLYEESENVSVIKDDVSAEIVEKYFTIIQEKNNLKVKKIKENISEDKKLVIWGTGALAMWLIQRAPDIKEKIICFLDNNKEKQGTYFCEKPICGSEVLLKMDQEVTIVICSMQSSEEIVNQIVEMNLKNEYFVL